MSLRKRLWRSNLLLLLTTVLLLVLAAGLMSIAFEDALMKDFESIGNSQLDSNVRQVEQILEEADGKNWKKVEEQLSRYGYSLTVFSGKDIVYSCEGECDEELLSGFKPEKRKSSQAEIFYTKKTTALGCYAKGDGNYLLAVQQESDSWWLTSLRHSITAFILVLLFAAAVAALIFFLLSSLFTRRMSMKITEPLISLSEGAKRIRNGNLTEDIVYRGDEEFEEVCDTFNEMQHAILSNREKQAQYEKARTDMVTGISHDLRTPLTAVQGYIKGIMDGVAATEEDKSAYLRTAYEATKEMNVLLQKLFDFSKVESGKLSFQMVEGDLAELVASYVAQHEVTAGEKKVEFSFEKSGEILPDIQMDVDQIRRILDNLLENSIKYAGCTPVKIRILVCETETNVVLHWKYNGKGVPEDKIGRIFEQFYRCDEARREKGSGVGLYVVKYIMEQHGGHVTAENSDGLLLKLYFPKGE